jgi:AcrR family transcriptional regulator
MFEQCQDSWEYFAMAPRAAAKTSYHHGDLESALVDAAIALVRKYGPDQLSLRAVSADVGVSPSASYHYFKDKDELVSAVGDLLFDRLATMQERAIAKVKGTGPLAARRRFEAMGYAYFKWAMQEPNLYRLIFGGFCDRGDDFNKSDSKSWNLLNAGLDELLTTGVITRSARQGGEVLVWSAVHGASSLAIEGLLPESAFPLIINGVQRSLGMKVKV